MPIVVTVFTALALLAFLAATIQVQVPTARPINWGWAGLALLTLVYLLVRASP